jgi:hypothetical protein
LREVRLEAEGGSVVGHGKVGTSGSSMKRDIFLRDGR